MFTLFLYQSSERYQNLPGKSLALPCNDSPAEFSQESWSNKLFTCKINIKMKTCKEVTKLYYWQLTYQHVSNHNRGFQYGASKRFFRNQLLVY